MSAFKDLENCYISISQTENESMISSDKDISGVGDRKFQSEEELSGRDKRNPNLIYSKGVPGSSKGKKPMYSSISSFKKPAVAGVQKQVGTGHKPELNLKDVFIDRHEYDKLRLKQYVELNKIDIVSLFNVIRLR
jgi:hypothetical protein